MPDPLNFLYESQKTRFQGYQPERKFEHGQPVVVARIAETSLIGYSSIIAETRLPAVFMQALIHDNGRAYVKLSTNDSAENVSLLHKICKAFSDGRIQLEPTKRTPYSVGFGIGIHKVMLCFSDVAMASNVAAKMHKGDLEIKRAA